MLTRASERVKEARAKALNQRQAAQRSEASEKHAMYAM
jgi:hypothetical protein